MGIFKDLGFKKNTSNEIVSPNTYRLNGKTFADIQNTLVARVGSDVILSPDVDGVINITNTALLANTTSLVNTHNVFGDGSCIATYQLNGNAVDLGGRYNGTTYGMTWGTGKFGQCGNFNGTSSYILLSNRGSTLFYNGNRSISFWVKTTVSGQYIFVRSDVGDTYDTNYEGIYIGGNTWVSIFRETGAGVDHGYSWGTNGVDLCTGAWNHIVMTFTSTTASLYVNGNFASNVTGMAALSTGAPHLRIGTTTGSYFAGSLDQIRFFNRQITGGEVKTLYKEEKNLISLQQTTGQNNWYKYQVRATGLESGATVKVNGLIQTTPVVNGNITTFAIQTTNTRVLDISVAGNVNELNIDTYVGEVV